MNKKSVVIIGAGISGLAAAYALHQNGYKNIVILEARDRLGGRLWTVEGIDLGGQWIHGTEGNPITQFAHQAQIPLLFVGGDSTYIGGWDEITLLEPNEKALTVNEKWECVLIWDQVHDFIDNLRRKKTENNEPDCSLKEAIEAAFKYFGLNERQKNFVYWHLNAFVRDDCAANLNEISTIYWDEGYELYSYGDSILPTGFEKIIKTLAKDISIKCNHIVNKISYSKEKPIEITTNKGLWLADYVIITVPLGILKANDIKFDPPLPYLKRRAIKRLGFGLLSKLILLFDKPFWPIHQYVFGCIPNKNTPNLVPSQIVNLYKTNHIPALAIPVGGEEGKIIENWSDEEALEWALNLLKSSFGKDIPKPKKMLRTQWSLDPFAKGSYSFMALGATPQEIVNLAQPIHKRIFFTGEATSRHYWGTIHGAYMTGLMAAAKIMHKTSIVPPTSFTENRRWRSLMMRTSRFLSLRKNAVSNEQTKKIKQVLSINPIFSCISSNELQTLALLFDIKHLKHGDILCKKGDMAKEIYIIAKGELVIDLKRGARIKNIGNVIGEYGLFLGKKRTATVSAKGEVTVFVMDYYIFTRFLLAFPEAMYRLLQFTIKDLI